MLEQYIKQHIDCSFVFIRFHSGNVLLVCAGELISPRRHRHNYHTHARIMIVCVCVSSQHQPKWICHTEYRYKFQTKYCSPLLKIQVNTENTTTIPLCRQYVRHRITHEERERRVCFYFQNGTM